MSQAGAVMNDIPDAAKMQALDSAVRESTPRPCVLVVDDDPNNRRLMTAYLAAEGYEIREASGGAQAMNSIVEKRPDLILLDVMMPVLDGYTIVAKLKALVGTKAIPVVLVTALTGREARLRGLEAGAEEFLTKPIERTELTVRVRNLLRLKQITDELNQQKALLEERVLERTQQLRESHLQTIVTLSRAAEYKDPETGAHITRISHYTRELALQLGEGAEFADAMFHASPMHDVGKIGIPDHVLLKTCGLSSMEWAVMRSHTTIGWEILRTGDTRYMQLGAEIALSHHERWNGTGYPNGWAREQIPLSARLLNICDQYDALRSKRPYKDALDHTTVVDIITKGDERTSPEHFDPRVLAAFVEMAHRFEDIFASFGD
jgi:putative two-component system response regulator